MYLIANYVDFMSGGDTFCFKLWCSTIFHTLPARPCRGACDALRRVHLAQVLLWRTFMVYITYSISRSIVQ